MTTAALPLVTRTAPTLNPLTRPWTADSRDWTTGRTRVAVKRACNGCGRLLGDATGPELEAAILGRPLPDVTAECGCARLEEQARLVSAVAVHMSPMHPNQWRDLAAEHDTLTDRGRADWHDGAPGCVFCDHRARVTAGQDAYAARTAACAPPPAPGTEVDPPHAAALFRAHLPEMLAPYTYPDADDTARATLARLAADTRAAQDATTTRLLLHGAGDVSLEPCDDCGADAGDPCRADCPGVHR